MSPCLSVHLSAQMSSKRNFCFMDEPILMKLYTVALYDLRKCMKEEDPGRSYFKGDYKSYKTGSGGIFSLFLLLLFCMLGRLCGVL